MQADTAEALSNPLKDKILQRLNISGAMSVAEYIALTMGDRDKGYYANAQPFGRKGDFITAPEVSQLFGEMLAIWVISTWQALGKPASFTLCEAGPGRGTLMDDVLRTIAKIAPACEQAAQIILVEISSNLRRQQQQKLTRYTHKITWLDNFTELENYLKTKSDHTPVIMIANELLDVLPIHQYRKTKQGWHERLIATTQSDNLHFVLGPPRQQPIFQTNTEFTHECNQAPIGTIVETSPERSTVIKKLSNLISNNQGAALLIDYGSLTHGFGDTVQGITKHQFCSILENIGNCDISSHVDFAELQQVAHAENCQTATLTQGKFLLQLGLLERAGRLGANKSAAEQQQITTDVERLAAPQQMGDLFKVLCIADLTTKMPPFKW